MVQLRLAAHRAGTRERKDVSQGQPGTDGRGGREGEGHTRHEAPRFADRYGGRGRRLSEARSRSGSIGPEGCSLDESVPGSPSRSEGCSPALSFFLRRFQLMTEYE